jgi:nucleotide-binding universal stress UspA family protein
VLPRHTDAGRDQPTIALEDREQQRLIREAADSARDAGVEATGVLVEGPPAKMILRQAATLQADMIIIGSHGFGPALEMLLGSVSKKVLRKARCPVLVVPIPRAEE